MPRPRRAELAAPAAGRPGLRLPATAERLRLPLYARNQSRMRERWGFDLNTPDAPDRADAILAGSTADPDRLLLVASVRSSRGDDGVAVEAARAAVSADETSARAHTTLATLLVRGGDLEAGRSHAQRAAELDPSDPTVLFNRGIAAWALGDHAAARADFKRAGELLGLGALPWWSRWRHRR